MKKWTLIDTARMPDGQILSLSEHDGVYSVGVGSVELMSTRKHSSEDRIAERACELVTGIRKPRVLIGGLGFGFTLKAALAVLPPDATVVMAEILSAVIAWNRNPDFPLAATALADPRVRVEEKDVVEVIRDSPAAFDSIILDVDNGPAALSTKGNLRLYNAAGLQLARTALRPGGCISIWSATTDAAFEKRMARAGFQVETEVCRAHGHSGSRHYLFIGRLFQ